jgi:hypothetical protein
VTVQVFARPEHVQRSADEASAERVWRIELALSQLTLIFTVVGVITVIGNVAIRLR